MWTVPNILTMARIAVLPVIIAMIWPGTETRTTCFWAAMVYLVAGITDMVDGYIARRYGQVTVFGKFLDPLADKLFYLVTMIALLQLPGARIPFLLVMVVLVRELSITGLRAIAASEGFVIAAGAGGKAKTTYATIGMACLIVHYPYVINFGVVQSTIDFHVVGLWLTYVSVAYSLSSGYSYVRDFVGALDAKRAQTA